VGATAKFLSACKVVSSRNSQLKLLLEEPLEMIGNDHPRYMTAHGLPQGDLDRIRLIMQKTKESLRDSFVFHEEFFHSGCYWCYLAYLT